MTTTFFVVAIVAAMVAMGYRRYRKSSLRRQAATMPGATQENAIYIRSFDEMDEHMRKRWCACGGFLETTGEGTRDVGGRRLRVARAECQECEETCEVYFDTTDLLQ